jgi:hypothetical protein
VLPVAAIPDEAPFAEPGEVGGDPRLRDPRHADQVRHAELPHPQERAQANPALVAEEVQRADVVGEAHVSAYDDARMESWPPGPVCQAHRGQGGRMGDPLARFC